MLDQTDTTPSPALLPATVAAPALPALSPPEPPATPLPAIRHDGWTPDRQQRFLACLAEGDTVEVACRAVGLTVASAYAFRRRANGAAFALGWQAAHVMARDRLADTLLVRAVEGVTETIVRPDGAELTRHRFDTRLSLGMLARLDRLADAPAAGLPAPPPAQAAARTVAQAWESYVELLADPDATDQMHAFVGAVAAAQDAHEAPLPPLRAAGAAADGAAPAGPAQPALPPPVWYSPSLACWLTSFPPPPGYAGEAWGDRDAGTYRRRLSEQEQAALADPAARAAAEEDAARARDAFFQPNRAARRKAAARGRAGRATRAGSVAPSAGPHVDAAPPNHGGYGP